MLVKRIFYALLLGLPLAGLQAQPSMEAGFALLEAGNYQSAAAFFDAYLQADPANRTARLCLGRAVGLDGAPGRARGIFSELLEQYPGDLELELNYAEALLWDGRYAEAKPYYQELMTRYPKQFGVLLGLANTLSNLKEYPRADSLVTLALGLQPGNPEALTSQKYIRMGWAYQAMQGQQYARAEALLDTLRLARPGDRDVHHLRADYFLQTKAYGQAQACYTTLEALGDTLLAWRGRALAWHLQGRPAKALEWARKGWEQVQERPADTQYWPAWERYVQALIWNRRYGKARIELRRQKAVAPSGTHAALSATLEMYTGQFRKSLNAYDRLLHADSSSFDGLLGRANALFAADRPVEALAAGWRASRIFTGQQDVQQFVEKVRNGFSPEVSNTSGVSFDNGKNQAYFSTFQVRLPLSGRWEAGLQFGQRLTENRVAGIRAETQSAQASIRLKMMPHTVLQASLGGFKTLLSEGGVFRPEGRLGLQFQPFPRQNAEVFYQRKVQDFNAQLLAQNLLMEQMGGNYHLKTTFGLGFFGQWIHQRQSDKNTGDAVFASLYAEPLTKPVLKLGVNGQYLGFAQQRPEQYFSPGRYVAWDGFAEYRPDLGEKTRLMAMAALGAQRIEALPAQGTFRARLEFTRLWGKRWETALYGQYSSQASSNAAGFEFGEAGFRIRYRVAKLLFNPEKGLK
ncbi:tetratricopeptide repeat protein [Robiginitalea sp. M366]|uniref:tetratricopeptide repeat protein n=1 Tax=Robiginitalea aestuariiviva TaxID=3036903 RepID=UPI00240DFA22|nr:tetratricopeptide repeat protein [Robiginitalea aestuariiviva]MDG1573369.1 tetratricopeptide repeat protein [Robiginitalea aestuariiviva]